jgi:hypothetical protein
VEEIKMANHNSGAPHQVPEKQAKRLRVRVVEDGHPTVNVKVPIGLAKWGMKMAQAFSPEMEAANLDWDSITTILQQGGQGSDLDHKTVEVWVE